MNLAALLWVYLLTGIVLLAAVRQWRIELLRLPLTAWSLFTILAFSWVAMMSGASGTEFSRRPGGFFEDLGRYPAEFHEVFATDMWWLPVLALPPLYLIRQTRFPTTTARVLKWTFWLLILTAITPLLKIALEFDWSAYGHFGTNYAHAWVSARMGDYFLNSTLVSTSSVGLASIVSSMAAYALARMEFRGASLLRIMVIIGLVTPGSLLLVPLFLTYKDMNVAGTSLANSRFGLSLIYAAIILPFTTLFLSAFYRTLPREYGRAALLDGASQWRVFTDIYLPLARSGLATTAIFNFLAIWNEYCFALVFANNPEYRTLPIGLYNLHVSQKFAANFPSLFAGVIILCLPTFAVFLMLHGRIVSGLTAGAIKR